jgi:hypothetical protein
MIARLLPAFLAMTGTAHAGAGGTFAPGGTSSVVIGLVAVAIVVIVLLRLRRK